MNDVKKIIKNLIEFQIDNIKNLLVTMNNNIKMKIQMDNYINNKDNIEIIKNKLNIFNGDIHFRNEYYISLINNFNKICFSYDKNISQIKESIIKIQTILYNNCSNEIKNIFNLKEEKINEQIIKIFEYDKFLSNLQKINFSFDSYLYLNSGEILLNQISKIYNKIKEIPLPV
jgi:hypothetical protein